MHAETSESATLDPREVEGALLGLLTSEIGPWTVAELEREVGGMHSNPTEVIDAIGKLYACGLVHVQGEFVSPTRAARRIDEIDTYRYGEPGRR
jgi:hypothetical protein